MLKLISHIYLVNSVRFLIARIQSVAASESIKTGFFHINKINL